MSVRLSTCDEAVHLAQSRIAAAPSMAIGPTIPHGVQLSTVHRKPFQPADDSRRRDQEQKIESEGGVRMLTSSPDVKAGQLSATGLMSDRSTSTWPRYLVKHMCRLRERIVKELAHIKWMNAPPRRDESYIPTEVEHIANVVTHMLGVVPSYRGMCHLLSESESRGQQLCAVVYGSALIALFLVSTIFHSIFFSGKLPNLKRTFHRLDRSTIYFFIASSYTPWLLLRDFHTLWDRCQIILVWVSCGAGILYQRKYHEKYKTFSVIMYCVIAIFPIATVLNMRPLSGIGELAVGGFFYLVGVIFFKLDGRLPLAHAIWHVCVDLAALIHFNAIATHLYQQQQVVGAITAQVESDVEPGTATSSVEPSQAVTS